MIHFLGVNPKIVEVVTYQAFAISPYARSPVNLFIIVIRVTSTYPGISIFLELFEAPLAQFAFLPLS